MCYSVTKPYGKDSTPGCTELSPHTMEMAYSLEAPVWTSNPMGIIVTCHPSYTMLTEMNGSATGAPFLTTSSTVKVFYYFKFLVAMSMIKKGQPGNFSTH